LITDIEHNGSMIVVHTSPGSASLVARQIDQLRGTSGGVLGTIAGDDTVFVCPRKAREIEILMKRIERTLSGADEN